MAVVAYFANWEDITAQINHIVNRSGVTFSAEGDTGPSTDKRYNDDVVNNARRQAAYKIFDAIASNLSHPYWGWLKTEPEVEHGAPIPPHYGEIGIPLIRAGGSAYRTGMEATPDEVESYLINQGETYGNFYGSDDDNIDPKGTDDDDP